MVKPSFKKISIKYVYIAIVLVIVIGAVVLLKSVNLFSSNNQSVIGSNQSLVQHSLPPIVSDNFVVLSETPPQLSQDALTGEYYFVGKIKINNTINQPLTKYTVTYTFKTSDHGIITLSQVRYLGPFEVYDFIFETPHYILPTETAILDNRSINVG